MLGFSPLSAKLIRRSIDLQVCQIREDDIYIYWGVNDLLDAGPHKIDCTLQHPYHKLNLTSGVRRILTTRNHVESWPPLDVEAEGNLFPCNSLKSS